MVIGIVGYTLGESDPTKTCKLDRQKPATCANRRSLQSIILCNFSEVGVKPVYVTDQSWWAILGSDCECMQYQQKSADNSKQHLLETAPDVPKYILLVGLRIACRR